MDDRMVVAAIQRGDSRGLASAYDVYADRLYAFCASMLRDPDAAADALHDTYIVASQRIGQLRDPDRLRPWLYAIARNECLRQMRARRRVTVLDEAGDVRDESVNLERDLREAEMRTLVWQAAEGLNPKERSALELSLRHGLEGRDLADALGVSVGHMNTLLTRARQQLERSLSAILVARTGRSDCPELAEIVSGWDGQLTVLMRKRISRHIDNCSTCSARKRTEVSATALLAAIPLIAAPFGLRRKILDDVDDMDLVGYRERMSERAGRFNREGFPVAHDSRRPPSGLWQWGAAAVILGLLLGLGSLLWQNQQGTEKASTANAAPVIPLPSPTPSLEPTAAPLPSPSPSPTPTPTITPSQPTSTIGTPTTNPARPTPRPSSRPPSKPPSTSPKPTEPSPKPVPGKLTVDPTKLDFGPDGIVARVTLTATGGQVAEWSASASFATPLPSGIEVLIVKPASGGPLADKVTDTVTIALSRGNALEFGIEQGTITFAFPGGSVAVSVSWVNPPPPG